MRYETFRLKGVLRFADEVFVDLRELPAGLVAFVGGNGEGKTGLLETAFGATYREFPSRGDRELLDYATSRDSFLETTFAIDGQGLYRGRVNLDGPKRNSDAVLEQILPDGRRQPLTDGRVSTYDDYIRTHFPPKDLVLASAFAAQNRRGSFVVLGKKERRDLFAQLLGLEKYEAMSATARRSAELCDQARERLVMLRDVLARDTSDAVGADLDRVERELDQRQAEATTQQADAAGRIAELDARLATMQDAVASYAAATQRIETLKQERSARMLDNLVVKEQRLRAGTEHRDELNRLAGIVAAGLADVEARAQRARTEHTAEREQIAVKLATNLKDVDDRVAGNQKLQGQADAIRDAVRIIGDCDRALAILQEDFDQKQPRIAALFEQIADLGGTLNRLDLKATVLARAKADAALLQAVPCGGSGRYASCEFLTNAQRAREQVSALEQEVAGRQDTEAALDQQRASHREVVDDLEDLKAHRLRLEAKKSGQQSLAKYSDALAAAEARLEELADTRTRLKANALEQETASDQRFESTLIELDALPTKLEADADEAVKAAETRLMNVSIQLDERTASIEARLRTLTNDIATAEGDINALSDKHERAIAVQVELRDVRAEEAMAIRTLAITETHQQDLQRRRAELDGKRIRYQNLLDRIRQVENELVDWQTIARATSRDGLPTIEIAAAGPTVSSYANDLMNVAFGPRFSLELVTEQAKRDGKGTKEVFSIAVLDNARGGDVRDISDLSGGEQIIVDEALKNALCIYMNQRAQIPMRTCWRDETTGPLDVENAPRYIQMLRRVQELAGFHHVLFVSHNAECAAMADAQIVVHDGKAEVSLPPFSTTAQEAA